MSQKDGTKGTAMPLCRITFWMVGMLSEDKNILPFRQPSVVGVLACTHFAY